MSTDAAGYPQAVARRLERIEALTDSALGHLTVEDLLSELLDRVLEILSAETAAVLLLDGPHHLVARAARGLEEEVRQGTRVPVGRGFAGTIAAESRSLVLDRVDETTVWNPILWEKGIRSMLGVPLLSAGGVIGVLHVGSLSARTFSPEDVQLLQVVADRIAGATHAELLHAEHDAAQALQRSLLPSELPGCPELEFAARYVPAEHGLGGDWYDVFTLPSQEVWAVSGDVQGHGFRSAVVMGRLRSTIRAYAIDGREPDEAVAMTDRKLQHFEPEEMATVLCVAFAPPFHTARLSCAGHPPPVLATPGAPSVFVDVDRTPPLGAAKNVLRSLQTADVSEGAVLFMYTDGLIERRGESLELGLDRVRNAVDPDHPEVVCHRVMSRLIGTTTPQDDIAVLAIRRSIDQTNEPRGMPT